MRSHMWTEIWQGAQISEPPVSGGLPVLPSSHYTALPLSAPSKTSRKHSGSEWIGTSGLGLSQMRQARSGQVSEH